MTKQIVRRKPYVPLVVGQKYNRWTLLEIYYAPEKTRCLCRCECGKEKVVWAHQLKAGQTRSCGCTRVKHRAGKTPTYRSWNGMVQRCCNPEAKDYRNWGGRGITICDRWRN